MTEESFPRQNARTRRFTLGSPRGFTISPDGARVLFLRSRTGEDPVHCLWSLDVETGRERLIVDPRALAGDGGELPAEEAARRERVRESGEGVVAYSCDRAARVIALALNGRLWVADAVSGDARELRVPGPVLDPRIDPTGHRVAYVRGDALAVFELAGEEPGDDAAGDHAAVDHAAGDDAAMRHAPGDHEAGAATPGRPVVTVAEPDGPEVTWGLPEFVAAEEMGRTEGHWWSPAGDALLAARVDIADTHRVHIADPAHPERRPREVAYPAAGTDNADVSLWLVGLDGDRREVEWDRRGFEYLVSVRWSDASPLMVVQSRDQRWMGVLEVDPATGATTVLREDSDPVWLDIVDGLPARTSGGELVWTADEDDTRRLIVGDRAVTPAGLQVRSVADVDGDVVLFTASREPTEIGLWAASPAGLEEIAGGPGVHAGRRAGGTTVVSARGLDRDGAEITVHRDGRPVARIASLAEVPVLTPAVRIDHLGERGLRTVVLLPTGHVPGSRALPVLLDPYGGPGMQRVLADRGGFLTSQWFADQGFAVVVADGRGTPGRGPAWDRSIRGDFAEPVLADQIDALHEAAGADRDLDLGRVAIRGWSFGGYLAALAVLRRPDVFHAAVSGAPVTEHRLYDTHYMERYLGHPTREPESYDRCSLIGDAPDLRRPLLLIHGLVDDNVLVAHTLRLSAALTAAGRPHSVLPLTGVTHMTPQPEVAENRLALELEFLHRSLGLDAAG